MAAETDDASEVKETDIVFDCPHCGKSLAIDYRGAGLTIPCSDCGNSVVVPIPQDMQMGDLDSNQGDQEGLILNLRQALRDAESRILELEAENSELKARREQLEKVRLNHLFRFGGIQERVGGVQQTLADAAKALAKVIELTREEEKPR
jgi:transcription elongation factor Elf1